MKIHRVIVQVARPTESFVGQVEECNYIHEDGSVTLVSDAGVPLTDRKGKTYTQKLNQGETPHQIAGRLTKQRFDDRGGDKKQFNRPLIYPKWSY